MSKRILTILLAWSILVSVLLTACTPTQIMIVVTATVAPSAPGNSAAATLPALLPTGTTAPVNNAPAPAATATTAPPSNAAPAPTNTIAPAAAVPATGLNTPVSINQLLDYQVIDPGGQPLGKVKDLVINRAASGGTTNGVGQIPYLIVKSNLNEDFLIPVPWSKIQIRPDQMAVVLPVTAAQLANAPTFNGDLWPASFTTQQAALQGFWANPGQANAPAAPLQGAPGQEKTSTEYIRAGDLLSVDLLSPQGVKLGKIKDLAVDWQNTPAGAATAQFRYLAMELDDTINSAEAMVPIPWRLVQPAPGQDNVILNINPALLQTAPNFAKGTLPNLYAEPWTSQISKLWPGQ